MKKILFLVSLFLISQQAIADHGPQRYWSMLLKVNEVVDKGRVPFKSTGIKQETLADEKGQKNFLNDFKDSYNLSAMLAEKGKVVAQRFNTDKNITPSSTLRGVSMTKTAASAVVGQLICDGKIKSITDTVGMYSKTLAASPYADVTVEQVLQMNSGVPPDRSKDLKKLVRQASGRGKYRGRGDLVKAFQRYSSSEQKPGSGFNYHGADSLALSIMVQELVNTSMADIFYEAIYPQFSAGDFSYWITDTKGFAIANAHLAMSPRDWLNFGHFISTNIKNNSCLGEFFKSGLTNAIDTDDVGIKYGYHFWVYDVNSIPTIVLRGHGGQFVILDIYNDKELAIMSIDENYSRLNNLFSNLPKVAERFLKK